MDDPDKGAIGVPGKIEVVEFYQGTEKLGEDASAPYSLTWTNVQAGAYALSAKAIDNAGAVVASNVAHITVTATSTSSLPSVTIASPANGSTLSSDLVSVQVLATLAVGRGVTDVNLWVDGKPMMSQAAQPTMSTQGRPSSRSRISYCDLPKRRLPLGRHVIQAQMTDDLRRQFKSLPTQVTIGERGPMEIPPAPPVTTPAPTQRPTPAPQEPSTVTIHAFQATAIPAQPGHAALGWFATGATGCRLEGGTLAKDVGTKGREVVAIAAVTSFTLSCQAADGTTASKTITVDAPTAPSQPGPVAGATLAFEIRRFDARPLQTRTGKSTLAWTVTGADSCRLTGGGLDQDAKRPIGQQAVTVSAAATTYTLRCSAAGGKTASKTVTVEYAPAP
jgi:hypothetical protein